MDLCVEKKNLKSPFDRLLNRFLSNPAHLIPSIFPEPLLHTPYPTNIVYIHTFFLTPHTCGTHSSLFLPCWSSWGVTSGPGKPQHPSSQMKWKLRSQEEGGTKEKKDLFEASNESPRWNIVSMYSALCSPNAGFELFWHLSQILMK